MLHMDKEKGLNSNQLKIIAIVAMTLDHLTWTLFPGYSTEWFVILFHIIGRLTAPIMWFFIAEGYHYTHDIKKYATRLFLLALISHFAYNFCFGIPFIPFQTTVFNQTGVVWSLAWGLILLYIHDKTEWKPWQKILITIIICLITFPSDWSCIATLAILAIGTNRGNFKKQMLWLIFYVFIYSVVYFFAIDKVYGCIQMCIVLAIPILMLYNGQRGKSKSINNFMKWAFYIYYPLHLFVIGTIQYLCR